MRPRARRGKLLTTSFVLSLHKIQFYVCFVLNNFAAIFQANLASNKKKERRVEFRAVPLRRDAEASKKAEMKVSNNYLFIFAVREQKKRSFSRGG